MLTYNIIASWVRKLKDKLTFNKQTDSVEVGKNLEVDGNLTVNGNTNFLDNISTSGTVEGDYNGTSVTLKPIYKHIFRFRLGHNNNELYATISLIRDNNIGFGPNGFREFLINNYKDDIVTGQVKYNNQYYPIAYVQRVDYTINVGRISLDGVNEVGFDIQNMSINIWNYSIIRIQ